MSVRIPLARLLFEGTNSKHISNWSEESYDLIGDFAVICKPRSDDRQIHQEEQGQHQERKGRSHIYEALEDHGCSPGSRIALSAALIAADRLSVAMVRASVNHGSDEAHAGEIALGEFVVARGDAPEILEPAEAALIDMALLAQLYQLAAKSEENQ
jgi:hypothetical protein